MTTVDPAELIPRLLAEAGPSKEMGVGAPTADRPHFFLVRRFLSDIDLVIIFNTRRCRYQCHFCDLPTKNIGTDASIDELHQQFGHVLTETRHALSVISKLTLSNEGSVFDTPTFAPEALLGMCAAAARLPALRTIALETRLEFVTSERIEELRAVAGNKQIEILTGFETLDEHLRDVVLYKREPLDDFVAGLDIIAAHGLSLTTYVLFKPDYSMSDEDAIEEARNSIEFLQHETAVRGIPLMIRFNPMYAAQRTAWADAASLSSSYRPPRLTDVLAVAKEARAAGTSIYIGLSAEGLAEEGNTYRSREDFTKDLLKEAIRFNEG